MTEHETTHDPATTPVRRPNERRPRAGGQPPQGGNAVYGIGMIGALVYFVAKAQTPGEYALAVGKSVVWPAVLVYLALKKLQA